MVGHTGRATDTHRIRRLRTPQPLEVETVEGVPQRLQLGAGPWQEVTLVRNPWRLDQYWWRADPIRRVYFRLLLPVGVPMTIFYDEVTGAWARQEY